MKQSRKGITKKIFSISACIIAGLAFLAIYMYAAISLAAQIVKTR